MVAQGDDGERRAEQVEGLEHVLHVAQDQPELDREEEREEDRAQQPLRPRLAREPRAELLVERAERAVLVDRLLRLVDEDADGPHEEHDLPLVLGQEHPAALRDERDDRGEEEDVARERAVELEARRVEHVAALGDRPRRVAGEARERRQQRERHPQQHDLHQPGGRHVGDHRPVGGDGDEVLLVRRRLALVELLAELLHRVVVRVAVLEQHERDEALLDAVVHVVLEDLLDGAVAMLVVLDQRAPPHHRRALLEHLVRELNYALETRRVLVVLRVPVALLAARYRLRALPVESVGLSCY